jgi:polar amino acid transport system substrate-binding protein
MKNFKKITSALLAAAAVLSICTACNSDRSVARVRQSGSLNVGYSSCNLYLDAPFVMGDKGLTAEPATKVASTMNAAPNFRRLSSDETYDRLLDGSVDCLWNVTSPPKEYVSSVRTIDTGIYYRQVIMTVCNSDITRFADVSGKKLAVVSGSDAQTALHDASVMESSLGEIKLYDNIDDILKALNSGEADCAAVDEPQALYCIMDISEKFKFIDTPIAECPLVIATRAEDSDLCGSIAEKYVNMVQDGQIKDLCKKYASIDILNSAMQSTSSKV